MVSVDQYRRPFSSAIMPVSTGGDGCCDFGILAFAGVLV
jgi:hypothetical protein